MADRREIPVFIYALTDPDTGVVGYVGKSSNPRARVASHISQWASRAVAAWVESLGSRPGLVLLRRVDPGDDADRWERHYIDHFRRHGQIVNDGRVANWRGIKRERALSLAAVRLARMTTVRGGQSAVAEGLGVGQGLVSRWVNGERKPGARLRGLIESKYGIHWSLWDQYPEAA